MLLQKLQSNVILERRKKFVKQIPMKSGDFYVIKMNMIQVVLSTSQNIGENSYIDRYSKGQYIGGLIYRSVSNLKVLKLIVCSVFVYSFCRVEKWNIGR